MHIHTYTHGWWAVFILQGVNPLHFTPDCSPFRMYICAALGVDASAWYAFLRSVELRLRGIINQVCLCMLGRLSSNGYGNKLDCCPTREAETLNGAKDSAFSSAFILPFFLLELRFILPSRVVCYKKSIQFRLSLARYIHVFVEVDLCPVPKLNS